MRKSGRSRDRISNIAQASEKSVGLSKKLRKHIIFQMREEWLLDQRADQEGDSQERATRGAAAHRVGLTGDRTCAYFGERRGRGMMEEKRTIDYAMLASCLKEEERATNKPNKGTGAFIMTRESGGTKGTAPKRTETKWLLLKKR